MSSRRDREDDEDESSSSSSPSGTDPEHPIISRNIPEPVEDFLRNSLRRLGLSRTLSCFEAEWYRSVPTIIPDAPSHRRLLQVELQRLRGDAERLREEALEAASSLARSRRERDFHRLQHRRLSERKDGLEEARRQLQEHLEESEEALGRLEEKQRAALRSRTLLGLRREKAPEPLLQEEKEAPIRTSRLQSPQQEAEKKKKSSFRLSCSIRAHQQPISCVALHPRMMLPLLLASASDDGSWRLWELPWSGDQVGQVLLTGEGHSDWLSGCSFHPDGSKLATTSGDKTVRLWDVSAGRCVSTLTGHSQPTWGSCFRSDGRVLASCAADGTSRLWDVHAGRCRLVLRRHASSVSSVAFLPSSELLLTCSADKTLIMWDARLGVAAAIFHGHHHPCSHAAVGPAPHAVASCDRRGVLHLWDTRKPPSPISTVDAGPHAANQVAFHQSEKLLAVASGDGSVRLVEAESGSVSSLEGHGGSVESVTFDHQGASLMSAGSDGLINVWF